MNGTIGLCDFPDTYWEFGKPLSVHGVVLVSVE